MAPIERLVRRIDARQQRTPVLAFPFAVVKKFGDDRAGGLAALMTYYGFLALFPMLLLLVTLLGLRSTATNIAATGSTVGAQRLSDHRRSATREHPFPPAERFRTGDRHPRARLGIARSHAGRTARDGADLERRGQGPAILLLPLRRGLLFIGLLGLDIALIAVATQLGSVGSDHALWLRVVNLAVATVLNVGVFVVAFGCSHRSRSRSGSSFPGASGRRRVHGLQIGRHVSDRAPAAAHQSGVRILRDRARAARVVVPQRAGDLYAAEVNVVRADLWPRSIVQPPFTEPDREVLRGMVEQEIRRPEQRVEVGFVDTDDLANADGAREEQEAIK